MEMPRMRVEPGRTGTVPETGILVRAEGEEHMGRTFIGNHDVGHLDRESLIAWLQMNPDFSNPKAESMVLILLGHAPLGLEPLGVP